MQKGLVRILRAMVHTRQKRMTYLRLLVFVGVLIGLLITFRIYETLKCPKALVNVTGGCCSAEDLEHPAPPKLWEQPTLLDLNFTWVMKNEAICQLNASHPQNILPVLVHTARSHFQERLAIRRTWGAVPLYRNWSVRFVFLMGEANHGDKFQEEEAKLQEEQAQYGDLVMGSFVDSYRNLTYKHLMGFKWVLHFCSGVTLVLKIDDDVFINIPTWLDWWTKDLDTVAKDENAKIPDLYCDTLVGAYPSRDLGNKWYVTGEEWPEPKYPDYCDGPAYALTVKLMEKIYAVSNERKMFWVDDVFVTGALLEMAMSKFHFKPKIKDISREVTRNKNEYSPMCERRAFNDGRKLKAVTYVQRGAFFERDMSCLFNKTLHDGNRNDPNMATEEPIPSGQREK